jgi:hypothetical protein
MIKILKINLKELLTNILHQITLKKQKNEYLKKSELGQKLRTRP